MEFRGLFAPGRCLSCRAPGPPVCGACRRGLVLLDGPCCDRCGRPTERVTDACRECSGRRLAFTSARAAVILEGPAHALVRAWKDRGLRAAADVAAELVLAVVEPPPGVVAVVPVPALAARAAWRGGDGALALAERLGRAWSLEVALPLRRGGGRTQRGLDRVARRHNARGQFRAAGAIDGPVLLVDDVYTTGATADVCGQLLRRAGASRVDVVTFARAVRR